MPWVPSASSSFPCVYCLQRGTPPSLRISSTNPSEPENQIAIIEALGAEGITKVGIVYNLHHGHGHLERLPDLLEAMMPHLMCLNLNGMDPAGDEKGRKILPLGAGTRDVTVLGQIRDSGYDGPIGILNHTMEDAAGRLLDNLDGLRWILPQLEGNKAGPKPRYRTWSEEEAGAPPGQAATAAPAIRPAVGVPSLSPAFGKALSGGLSVPGEAGFHNLPFTIECRAKLDSKERYNILVACNPKSADTHWELYTHAKRGTLALYLPGRGGDFDSGVDICDGEWHDLLASVDETKVRLWVNGELVLEKPIGKLPDIVRHAGVESFAIGRLVEGRIGRDGLIDDLHLSRALDDHERDHAGGVKTESVLPLFAAHLWAKGSNSYQPGATPSASCTTRPSTSIRAKGPAHTRPGHRPGDRSPIAEKG